MSLTKVSYSMIDGECVNVIDYGAVGDGVANDYAAIIAARNAARARGTTLHFPAGTYAFGTVIDFGQNFERVTFDDGVTLKYTGSGDYGITFDGGATGFAYYGSFGWGCPPLIQASNSAKAAVFLRSWHHGRLDFRCNAAPIAVLETQFAVCTEFRVVASVNHGPWVTRPINGIRLYQRPSDGEGATDCIFYNTIIEGVSGDGIVADQADYCLFLGGTSEGNGGSGYVEGPGSFRNVVENMFCEANYTVDFYLNGQGTTLRNCTGTSSGGGVAVLGPRTVLDHCEFKNITVSALASGTTLKNTSYYDVANGGSFTNSGTGTVLQNCYVRTANGYVSLPNSNEKPKSKRVGQMAIASASQAAKCIVQIFNHNLDFGDSISITSVVGMTELNGNTYTVEPISDNLVYILSGGAYVNSTGFGAYVSGGQATYVAFQNSWANFSTPWRGASFSKSADGYVTFGGVVTAGSVGTIMFTLPDGYKPSADCMFAIANSDTTASVGTVQVKADGKVYFVNGAAGSPTTFVSLDNVRFLTV